MTKAPTCGLIHPPDPRGIQSGGVKWIAPGSRGTSITSKAEIRSRSKERFLSDIFKWPILNNIQCKSGKASLDKRNLLAPFNHFLYKTFWKRSLLLTVQRLPVRKSPYLRTIQISGSLRRDGRSKGKGKGKILRRRAVGVVGAMGPSPAFFLSSVPLP